MPGSRVRFPPFPPNSIVHSDQEHFCAKGVFGAGGSVRFAIEEAQIVLHKADKPHLGLDQLRAPAGQSKPRSLAAPANSVLAMIYIVAGIPGMLIAGSASD